MTDRDTHMIETKEGKRRVFTDIKGYEMTVVHEFRDNGWHRLRCGEFMGQWTSYNRIAQLTLFDHEFLGITEYHSAGHRILRVV